MSFLLKALPTSNTGTAVFTFVIASLVRLAPYLAQILYSWTTLGILSSEREYLNQLSRYLDSMDNVQENDRCLSDDSREHLKEFGRTRSKYVSPCLQNPSVRELTHPADVSFWWMTLRISVNRAGSYIGDPPSSAKTLPILVKT